MSLWLQLLCLVIFSNNIMRHYDSGSMVDKVHQNVRFMLSQAREIVNQQPKITINRHQNQSFSLKNLSSKLFTLNPKSQESIQIAKMKMKKRPLSEVSPTSQGIHPTNRLKSIQAKQMDKPQDYKKIKFSSFLNKDQKELIDPSYRKFKKAARKNRIKTILPTIARNKTNRSHTESSGKYCLTISIEALQKIADQRIMNSLALRSLAAENIEIVKQAKPKRKLFEATKRSQKGQDQKHIIQETSKKDRIRSKQKLNVYYEPWGNKQDYTDDINSIN